MRDTLRCIHSISGVAKPISVLGLGTTVYRLPEKDLAFRMLDGFVDVGGTVIDTARAYSGGESETVIGMWIESRRVREKMAIITKCGHGKEGTLCAENFEDMVSRELGQSLERLGTDYIDLYLLHRDNRLVPVAKIIDCMNEELSRGRIHAFGVSNWEYDRIDSANEYACKNGLKGFAAVSNNSSLAVPNGPFYRGLVSVDRSGESWHRETGTPLISWSSMARGFFTGRYTQAMSRDLEKIEDGFKKRMVKIYGTADNFMRFHRARLLGGKKGGYSAVEIALAWVLNRPYPVVAVVGPHSIENLTSCVRAASLGLSDSEMKYLCHGDEV
jgi:1-deoxyxylulose-5-phosphate synthase